MDFLRGLLLLVCVGGVTVTQASEREVLEINKTDNLQSVLIGQQDKSVTLKLASGQEISGKLKSVGAHVVYITQVRGIEYFDAVVDVKSIEALVVRVQR